MEGGTQCNPQTVEGVFNDFNGRRDALIKALTTDFDEFFKQCDPEKGNLCLFGFPSGNWEVNVPVEQVPTDLPEPALGINFARDMMQEHEWVALVAVRSDAWLFSVAHYFGAKFGFGQSDRIQLFNMINDLPTVFETVFDTWRKREEEKASSSNKGRNKSKSGSKGQSEPEGKKPKKLDDRAVAEEGVEVDRILCSGCGENYSCSDFFWISCHFCKKWNHGQCVKMSSAKAQFVEQYKCPSCYDKKLSRP